MGINELLDELSRRGVDLWVEGDRLKFRSRSGSLSTDIREAVARQKHDIIQHLGPTGCTVRRAPLSHNQEGLYFLYRTAPADVSYNVGFALRIRSAVNRDALRDTLQALIDRHESLRTTYEATSDGEPRQLIWARRLLWLEFIDLAAAHEDELRSAVVAAHHLPFDLERGPIVRTSLFTRAPDDHVLLFSFHHIAGDGQSVWTMLNEFRLMYKAFAAGGRAELPVPASTYRDFVDHQRALLADERGHALQQFWKTHLAIRPDPLALPWRLDAPGEKARGAAVSFVFPEDLSEGLRGLARAQATTLFTVLMAAWQLLLLRYSSQEEILVGTPVLGRTGLEFQDVVGNFVNTVVVRGRLDSTSTFNSFLATVRDELCNGIEHQDYPFSLMVHGLGARWDPGRTPLFETMFQLQRPQQHDLTDLFVPSTAGRRIDFGGLAVEPFVFPQQEAMTDISFEVIEQGATLLGHLKYRLDRLDPGTVERMRAHLEVLLRGIVAAPSCPVVDLPLVDNAEERRLVNDWNATAVAYDRHESVAQRFEAVAREMPEREALVVQGKSVTYGALNQRANQIAHRLRLLGIGPEALVGIALTRSADMVASLLGVLKAGGGYVPLDPDFPRQRLAWMIEDSRPRIILTEHAIVERLPADAGVEMLVLDSPDAAIDTDPSVNLPPVGDGDALAYTIFTSGSTGRPKGIQIPRGAVTNFLTGVQQHLNVTRHDRLLAVTTLSFDIAVLELLLPLTQGATVVLATRDEASDPARLSGMAGEEITIMQATPATWRMLCEAGWKGHEGLKILCGGEALPPDLAATLVRCGRELWNMYGPTETTVWSSMERVTREGDISIGRPIANTSIYVLDRNRRLLPAGLPGELWIGGDGVARGYLGLPEMTNERFVANPFRPAERMYRTGDLARWRTDGKLEHLGRADQQVKVRGFRIELQEIEQALTKVPGIASAAAAAFPVASGDCRLVAYCTANPGQTDDEKTALKASLRTVLKATLPDYAVPSHIEFLDHLPMTPNGKIDRRALPAPTIEKPRTRERVRPMSAVEDTVARIWADVLDVTRVGLEDDFFELGGHSLLAARLMRQLNDIFWIDLPLRTLFEASTVAGLSEVVVQRMHERRPVEAGRRNGTIAINTDGDKPPFFFFHAALEGEGFYCYNLARLLGANQPLYAFEPLGLDGQTIPPTIEDMARVHVEAIRQIQPHGPYFLGAFCISGGVALEAAQQLRERGEEVAMLVVIESYLARPDHMAAWASRLARLTTRVLGMSAERRVALNVQLRWAGQRVQKVAERGMFALGAAVLRAVVAAGRSVAARAGAAMQRSTGNRAMADPTPRPPRLASEAVQTTYQHAIYAYVPQPYRGRLVCVSAETAEYDAEVWQAIGTNVERRTVPGDHNTCITTKVTQLAEMLREVLGQSQYPTGDAGVPRSSAKARLAAATR